MKRMTMAVTMDSLTEDLFSLDEPWRGRFLRLVAARAMQVEDMQPPTPEEVSAWFEADPSLRRRISTLLYMWQGARRRSAGSKGTFPGEHLGNRS
jgi:hypothetical protein